MSLFSLIPYNAHSQNLPFHSEETTATDNKCSLFPNITCEMALEIFNAFGIYMTSLCFHVVGTNRNLPSHWHQNGPGTALL